MNFSPVAISGMGSITPNGVGPAALWKSALEERSCIVNGLGHISESILHDLKETYPVAAQSTPAILFAYASIQQAMKQAGWTDLRPDDGLILATTTGQISAWEGPLLKFLNHNPGIKSTAEEFADSFQYQSLGLAEKSLSEVLNFKGQSLVVSSACSAATQAIAIAALWIQTGKVKRCLVGGTEVLSVLTTEGFKSLQLLSSKTATPFDEKREGINLSEGAAFFCLEKSAKAPIGFISGYGFSTDAYHLASPHPEGKGCLRAMQNALSSAGLKPSDISWIHAHGTGSRANDLAEGAAISQLFGAADSDRETPWVSSTKAIHGHALGASGAVETVLCLESLQRGVILRTAGLLTPDPAIKVKHPRANVSLSYRHIVKNTLGFGGNNAALVISRGTL